MWLWWVFSHHYPEHLYKVRALCRLRVGQNCLKEVVSNYNKSSPICELCSDYMAETLPGLLFYYKMFIEDRQLLWQGVVDYAMNQET